jgi:hypothetical protein
MAFQDSDIRLISVMSDDTMSVVLDLVGRKSILPLLVRNRIEELQTIRQGGGYVITRNLVRRVAGEVVRRSHGKITICFDEPYDVIEFLLSLIIKSNNQDLQDGAEECCVEIEFLGASHVNDTIIQEDWISNLPEDEVEEVEDSPAAVFKRDFRYKLQDSLRFLGKAYKFDRAS